MFSSSDNILDRTASNPLFGDKMDQRGAPPIPEEYQKKNKHGKGATPPPPPSAPPPDVVDEAAHVAFEQARIQAAKKREAKPLSFKNLLPYLHSGSKISTTNTPENQSLTGSTITPTHSDHNDQQRQGFSRFLPRLPSKPREYEVSEEDHLEFDRLKKEAEERRKSKRMIKPPSKLLTEEIPQHLHDEFDHQKELALNNKRGIRISTPLARVVSAGQAFFALNPPPIIANTALDVEDDGEKITNLPPPEPKRIFKSRTERIAYEVKYQHGFERAIMACLAVSLLWLTSLAAAQSFVYNSLSGPNLNAVVASVNQSANDIQQQRDLYSTCAARHASDCNTSFNSELADEVEFCQQGLEGNRQMLNYFESQRAQCSNHLGEVVQSLQYLQINLSQSIDPLYSLYPNLSSVPICSTVKSTLASQIAAISGQAVAQGFSSTANNTVNTGFDQYQARIAYDTQYSQSTTTALLIAGNNLNTYVADPNGYFANMSNPRDAMYACASATGVSGAATCPVPSLGQSINNMRNTILTGYSVQVASINSYGTALQYQYQPVKTFYDQFSQALATVAGLKSALDGAANNNGGGGGGLATFGYTGGSSSITPLGSLPDPSTFTQEFLPASYALNQIGPNQNTMTSANAVTQTNMNLDATNTKNGQTSWQATYFSDYNPPPYDIQTAEQNWIVTSTAYVPALQSNLNIVAKSAPPPQQEAYEPTTNTSDSNLQASVLNDALIPPLNIYVYPNINLDLMLLQWNSAQNLALIMDYTYRALRSLSIIRYYFRVSAVMAPPADVRVAAQKAVTISPRKDPYTAMAEILTNPAVLIVLGLLFIGICSALFLGMYLPFYNGYTYGCVDVPANSLNLYTDNGTRVDGRSTMITENANTIAFQYAARDGDTFTATSINRANVERNLQCSQNENSVYKQQQAYQQEFDYNFQQFLQLNASVQSFRSCINATAIDQHYPTLAFAATNGVSSSVNASLFDSSCDFRITPLNNVAFDCNAIQNCSLTCSGPHAEEIGATVYHSGCLFEYYLHSNILGTAMAALVFILLNFSRIIFLNGLRRVLLDHFATGEYSYLGTTNEYGEQEYPTEMTENSIPFKDFIREELHRAIKQYKRSGIYICIFGLSINIPWIYALISFSDSIK